MTLIAIVITAALAIFGQIPSSSADEPTTTSLLILQSPPQQCFGPQPSPISCCNVNIVVKPCP